MDQCYFTEFNNHEIWYEYLENNIEWIMPNSPCMIYFWTQWQMKQFLVVLTFTEFLFMITSVFLVNPLLWIITKLKTNSVNWPCQLHTLTNMILDTTLISMVQQIDGLAQDYSDSIANALELLQSCTKPWKYSQEKWQRKKDVGNLRWQFL